MCELCHYITDRSSNLKKHFETKKHVLNAYYESRKNNISGDINSNIQLIPKTYSPIDNFQKNSQKNDINLLEKTDKLSIDKQVLGIV